ncbi:DUF2867 domain-containing protein [Ornithinimicrobium ciconiae]|uniref:DUF2867 domain-containing protein n=1 Tax=Ornithinimicrobium ciconiae TaxID=2594265 RepID=A0A516GEM9_9MICO|nr:DUF2867 domain-containing protein [Ornithinimicrobium ciconiae]QDO89987.1 DUF2867 domain-containing protein [Ornithinimicrobium ciconiae]
MALTMASEAAAPLRKGARHVQAWALWAETIGLTATRFLDARARGPQNLDSPVVAAVAEVEASEVLPGWDYADAYECRWASVGAPDAMTVARALLGPSPSARRVLAARDLLVAPLGVQPAYQGDVLLFPIQVAGPERVVCGLDDRHLDFRVIVTLLGGVARCTTVVRRHGYLGAAYFAVVRPFHRRLVPHLMRQHPQAHVTAAEAS